MSFKIKIALWAAFIQLVATLGGLYFHIELIKSQGETDIIRQAETVVNILGAASKEAILVNDYAQLDSLALTVIEHSDVLYARIINEEGEVMAKNGRKEFLNAPFKPVLKVEDSNNGSYDTYSELYAGNYYIGRVEVGISTKEYQQFVADTIKKNIILSSFMILATLIFSYILAHILTKQIYRIADASAKIADGKLGETVPVAGSDELAQVSETFNAMSLSVRDNAEAKEKLLNNLEIAKQQAESSSNAKTSFIAVMGHEIRTPLNIIVGMVDLLKAEETDSSRLGKFESISDASENLMNILNDLLDIAKLDTGNMELESTYFDLRESIKNTTDFFSFSAESKGLQLVLEMEHNVPSCVQGDKHRLRQILSNLISNAIKFTPEGKIIVRLNAQPCDDGHRLYVDVQDTGIGISSSNIDKIFEVFIQADKSMSRKYGGSGLGLAICKKLVQMMEGDISVTSKPGQGSTFSFNVKLSGCFATQENIKSQVVIHTGEPSILIAEDVEDNRRLIEMYTKELPIKTTFADDGEQVLEMFRKEHFHLILMDRRMPVVSGDKAASTIREMQAQTGYHTPIFSFSADYHDKTNDIKGLYDGHFPKPFKKKDLHNFLTSVFPDIKVEPDDLKINIDPELADLVPSYIERKEKETSQMKEYFHEGDFIQVEKIAHSIKGTGRSYGFELITEIAREIEVSAKRKDKNSTILNITRLQDYIEKVRKTLI